MAIRKMIVLIYSILSISVVAEYYKKDKEVYYEINYFLYYQLQLIQWRKQKFLILIMSGLFLY